MAMLNLATVIRVNTERKSNARKNPETPRPQSEREINATHVPDISAPQ